MHFYENLIQQKLLGASPNGRTGQVKSGPRCHPDIQEQVHVQGGLPQAWSLGYKDETRQRDVNEPRKVFGWAGYSYPSGPGPKYGVYGLHS